MRFSIDQGSTARMRVSPRCPGAPRPSRARSLDAGRSPGSRPRRGPPSRRSAMAWWAAVGPVAGTGRSQLRGQPLARSRFSPCGPPASGGTL